MMKESKEKGQEVQYGIMGLAAIIALGLGWLFIVMPGFTNIKNAKKAIEQEKQRQTMISGIEDLKKSLQEKEELLMSESSRYTMVSKLTKLAKSHHLQLLSLEPSDREMPLYSRGIFNMNLSGKFVPFTKFVEELETMEPAMMVQNFSIEGLASRRSRSEADDPSMLTIKMEIQTLIKKKNNVAKT